jgi:hypothetical protein
VDAGGAVYLYNPAASRFLVEHIYILGDHRFKEPTPFQFR